MKRFLSLLSVTVLFVPMMASAMTPMEVSSNIFARAGSTFSMTLNMKNIDGVYVSLWANGTMGFASPVMDINTTIDMVNKDLKGRMKGSLRMIPDGLYVNVTDISGSFNNQLALMNMNVKTKQWLQVMSSSMMQDMFTDLSWRALLSRAGEDVDAMFNVQEVPSATGKTYVLSLKPDAAAGVARELLDILGGDRPVIQDFFPWRALAESMNVQVTVQENTKGEIISRSVTADVTGSNSYLKVSSTEKILASLPVLNAPVGAFSYDQVLKIMGAADTMLSGGGLGVPSLIDLPFTPIFPDTSFDNIDTIDWSSYEDEWNDTYSDESSDFITDDFTVYSGDCWSADGINLVSLQRSGDCSVEKVSRRNLSN